MEWKAGTGKTETLKVQDFEDKKFGNSQISYLSACIDGVHCTIFGHPSKTKFMFSFKMNKDVYIKSKFYDSLTECVESLQRQRKDLIWRRAIGFAKNNPPTPWISDYQI